MPSRHGGSRYSKLSENYLVRVWEDNVRGVLFGVLYTMTKENTLPNIFVLLSIILEFFQIIIFCFRTDYKWGGLSVDTNVNIAIIGYPAFLAIFWLVVALVIIGTLNGIYVGYSFHKGEAISVHFLRALRWICSLIVSVLFIPIESVLITGVACNYSKSPPMLILFPEQQCWGGANVPVSIVGILVLIVFSLLALFTGLTYYEFDPSIINASGRLQNRFEFGSLWVKMLLVFVNYFLESYSMVMAGTVLFSAVTLFVSYLVMLPAYDHKLNLVRSGSFGGVLWVAISMFISIGINNPHNYLSIVVVVAGTPFAIGLGVYAADRRYKYICNPDLVGEVTDDGKKSIVRKMGTKVVKWEQPTKEPIKNKLYDRLMFPTDVEIAARFVLTNKPNLAIIEKAKTVYHTGLSKFPNSPSVMQGYVNFIFTVLGDWQLGYNTIEKLRKMHPLVDIQFFIYRYDKDREQRSDGSKDVGDFVRYMEFKKMHQAAKRFHSSAQVSIRKFWRKLLEPKVDVLDLSDFSRDIAIFQKRADEQYEKLLELHPKNIRVLRDYARFLDEIMNNDRGANELWKKADKYETREMEKLTESHRSEHVSPKHGFDDHSEGSSHKSDTEHSTEFYDDTISTASSGMAVGLAQATQERISKLNVLSWIMFFTTLFALVYGFVQLGVVNTQLNQYESIVQALDGAGGILQGNLEMGNNIVDAYSLALSTINGDNDYFPWAGDYDTAMESARVSALGLENNMKSIYWGTSDSDPFTTPRIRRLKIKYGYKIDLDPTAKSMDHSEFNGKIPNKKRIDAFFDDPVLSAYYGMEYANPKPEDYRATDLWSLAMLLTGTMKTFSQMDIYEIVGGNKGASQMGNLLLANIPPITDRCLAFMDLCSTFVSEKLDVVLLSSLICFIIAVALLILTAGGIYSRVVNSIFNYKVKALQMFAIIPIHIVTHMAKKKMSNLRNEGDSDASDGEDDNTYTTTDKDGNATEKVVEQVVVKSAEIPSTPAPVAPPLIPSLAVVNKLNLSAAIRDVKKTPRGTETEFLRTPCGSELEVLKTPRGSEILRTPRGTLRTPNGSEITKTPRGFSDSQKQTLLLPNSCESRGNESDADDEDEDEDEDTFKDALQSSVEIRITEGLANGLAQAGSSPDFRKVGNGAIVENTVEYEVGSSSKDKVNTKARKRHTKSKKDIEMHDLRVSKRTEQTDDGSESPQRVRSFRDKLSLSLLPVVTMHRSQGDNEEPLIIPTLNQTKIAKKYVAEQPNTKVEEASKARVTVGSLRGVVLKVHATYMFAIVCFIAIMLTSFLITRGFIDDLESIATDVRLSVVRVQRTYLLVHYASLMAFPIRDIALSVRENFKTTLDECYRYSWEIPAKDYQMDFLYANDVCMRIDETNCPTESYEYYDSVKYGFSQLYFSFLTSAQQVLSESISTNNTVATDSDVYQSFRNLAENDVYDGLAILTFATYTNAIEEIRKAKKVVGIVTGVSSAACLLIHLILFRPFVKKLRAESEYIFVILNMIPRKMLSEVPEIMNFLRSEADLV